MARSLVDACSGLSRAWTSKMTMVRDDVIFNVTLRKRITGSNLRLTFRVAHRFVLGYAIQTSESEFHANFRKLLEPGIVGRSGEWRTRYNNSLCLR